MESDTGRIRSLDGWSIDTMCFFWFCFLWSWLHIALSCREGNGTGVLSTVFLVDNGLVFDPHVPRQNARNRTHGPSRSSGGWEQDFFLVRRWTRVYSGIGWGASQSKLGPSEA